MEQDSVEKASPSVDTCAFVIARKNRRCRMQVKTGHRFCGEHALLESGNTRVRIRCPLDPRHTCFEDVLKKHLKHCNAMRVTEQPWYEKDVNLVCTETSSLSNDAGTKPLYLSSEVPLKTITSEELIHVVERIESFYESIPEGLCSVRRIVVEIQDEFKLDVRTYPVLEKELDDPTLGQTKKHLIQLSSLVGHLERLNLLDEDICYLEFGSGRGRLSLWISRAMKSSLNCGHCLIERSGSRYKFENKALNEDCSDLHFCRLRCDIEHVNLRKVEFITQFPKHVAVWKHLCGSATDVAIRALQNAISKGDNRLNLIGFAMAPCCHHRLQWESYVGQEFLISNGLTKEEFKLLTLMSSWATCGFEFTRAEGRSKDPIYDDELFGLTNKRKVDVGCKLKRIFDFGRVGFLRKMGFGNTGCVLYVDAEVSPENTLVFCGEGSSCVR